MALFAFLEEAAKETPIAPAVTANAPRAAAAAPAENPPVNNAVAIPAEPAAAVNAVRVGISKAMAVAKA